VSADELTRRMDHMMDERMRGASPAPGIHCSPHDHLVALA
jgi:hypothetical protein